jgi:hypothetical protein
VVFCRIFFSPIFGAKDATSNLYFDIDPPGDSTNGFDIQDIPYRSSCLPAYTANNVKEPALN